MAPKTYVYVDGFNLYYRAVRGTPFKWLNIRRLCELLLPGYDIVRIKYFTARVRAHADDPDAPQRQQVFLRALRTIPDFEIIYGSFLSHEVTMRLAHPMPGGPKSVRVMRTEEKGSDVNLGAHLVHDAHLGRFEVAAVVSNDSDLREPIRIVSDEMRMPIIVVNPHPGRSSLALKPYGTIRQVRAGALRASQFPVVLRDAHGEIRKPATW